MKPRITYGSIFQTDCTATTETNNSITSAWEENEGGLSATLSSDGDIFTITGIADAVGDELAYYAFPALAGADNLSISTTTYTRYYVRWKTSAASNGLQAVMYLHFSDASIQTVTLGYSTSWKVSTGTITTAKTLDHISLGADDNPDSIAAGTFYVYYDWAKICITYWEFPFIRPGGIRVHGQPRYVRLRIPGRMTDIKQYLGEGNIQIELTGDYDASASWYSNTSGTTYPLDFIPWNLQGAGTRPWEYFECDKYKGKVTIEDFELTQASDGTSLGTWRLLLEEFRLNSPSNETVYERYGLL